MATSVVVSTGPVRGSNVRRGAPRKVFRARKRTQIRKTLAHLNSMVAEDFRENARSAALNYPPAFICNDQGTPDQRAFARVIARLQTCMTMTEGS